MEYRSMNVADAMCEDFVDYVRTKYGEFSDLSKALSDGRWEEWIRNHIEAKIYLSGGTTLSKHKREE